MKNLQHLGYQFSQSQRSIHLLQYADDTCFMSDGPAGCKRLEHTERWLNWSGMKAKVPKCHSLAIQASTAKSFNPNLTLYEHTLHWNQGHQVLGFYHSSASELPHHQKSTSSETKIHAREGRQSPCHHPPEAHALPCSHMSQTELGPHGQRPPNIMDHIHSGSRSNPFPEEMGETCKAC